MNTAPQVYNIYFNSHLDAVVMEWDGYANSRQFREGTEEMLRILRQFKASRVLGDIADMVLIGMEDQKWLEEDFLPRAISAGFRTIAMVRPSSYFNKVAVESVSYKIDKEKLDIQFFSNREEAEDWLKAMR